uniref:uncharacterized protein LOC124061545 isoform X2 n=1 Tax=Scatophagus argus TaxID=75038 RepID=UPI001ED83D98|nr:uncharacterized protein LOC124061545 isoform X2 [Scatophagus argus]XP_046249418.1 uncharacterized protein LOC124061545 isoform X2 [Scatophagus argus]
MEQKEMLFNHTTPHISPSDPKPAFRRYFVLIPFVVLTLIGCVVAMVVYMKRRSRLEELRHRLIPLYSYDPTEEQDGWEQSDNVDEEEELTEPLYKEGKLSFSSSAYGT